MGRDESASWNFNSDYLLSRNNNITTLGNLYNELRMRLDYGSPLSRNRVIIFLLRKELMVDEAASNLLEFVTRTAERLQCEPEISW